MLLDLIYFLDFTVLSERRLGRLALACWAGRLRLCGSRPLLNECC
jgi:hypothetical protein